MRTRKSQGGEQSDEEVDVPDRVAKELRIDGKDTLKGEKVDKGKKQTYKWGGRIYEITPDTPAEWLQGKPSKDKENASKRYSMPTASTASPVVTSSPKKRAREDGIDDSNAPASAKRARTSTQSQDAPVEIVRTSQKVPTKSPATGTQTPLEQFKSGVYSQPSKKQPDSEGSDITVTPKTTPNKQSAAASTSAKKPRRMSASSQTARTGSKRPLEEDDTNQEEAARPSQKRKSQSAATAGNTPPSSKRSRQSLPSTAPIEPIAAKPSRRKTLPAPDTTSYFGISRRKTLAAMERAKKAKAKASDSDAAPSRSKTSSKASSKLPTPPAPNAKAATQAKGPRVAASSDFAGLFTEEEVQGFARTLAKIAKLNSAIDQRKQETEQVAADIAKIKEKRAAAFQMAHEQREAQAEAEEMESDSEDERERQRRINSINIDQAPTPSSSEKTSAPAESSPPATIPETPDAAPVEEPSPVSSDSAPNQSLHPEATSPTPPPIPTTETLFPSTNRGGQELRWSQNIKMNAFDPNRAESALYRGRLSGESASARRRRMKREQKILDSLPDLVDGEREGSDAEGGEVQTELDF